MSYDPYAQRLSQTEKKVSDAQQQLNDCTARLNWYKSFKVEDQTSQIADMHRATQRMQLQIEKIEQDLASEIAMESALVPHAKLGWDPRRWFSQERKKHARLRKESLARLKQLDKALLDKNSELGALEQAIEDRESEIKLHRSINPLELQATQNALQKEIEQLRNTVKSLREERDKLDAKIQPLLREQSAMEQRLSELRRDIDKAQKLEQKLNRAANAYEKRMVHQECEIAFSGVGSPSKVKGNAEREMRSINNNLEKLRIRIERIATNASRDVKTLVIDGNNLCYEADSFIGLDALLELTYALEGNYSVLVVFDAGIRGLMRMNDQQITHLFPRGVRVHIVPTKTSADQSVLELAEPVDAYVISNDRFKEYPEKSAVTGQRLIRHEILQGMVYVRDLDLKVPFNKKSA